MTFKEKFLHRIRMAEAKDREVDRWEEWATRRNPGSNEELNLLRIRHVLEKRLGYRTAVNVRDNHLKWAQVYGLAALLEEVDGPDATATGP